MGGRDPVTAGRSSDQEEADAAPAEEREMKRIMAKALRGQEDGRGSESAEQSPRTREKVRPHHRRFRSDSLQAQVRVLEAKHKSIWHEETLTRQRELEEKITGEPPGVDLDLAGRSDTERLRRPSTLITTDTNGKSKPVVDPAYALSCVEAVEEMAKARHMTPIVGDVLRNACKAIREGLNGGETTGVKQSRNFYCIETGVLKREIEALREQCKRKQARVGTMKHEYVDLVQQFAAVEDDLEKILEEYHAIEASREKGKGVVEIIQAQVDEEVRKQEQFAVAIEEQTKAVYRISQLLYEATNRRRDLRVDLRRATKKFETYREEMELNKGTVAKEEFEAVCQEILEVKDQIAVREASMQMRQAAYMEVVHGIQDHNEELRRERTEHQSKVEKEKELERSLTPRPRLEEALPLCKNIVMDEGKLLTTPSPSQGPAVVPGNDRNQLLRPTKEAVLEIAKEIERLGLDGPKLLQAHEELRTLQKELRDARSQLKVAESYVSMELTLANRKFLTMSGRVRASISTSADNVAELEWYEREMYFEHNKRGELLLHALGRGSKVPHFLKHEGTVPIRMMPRGELRDLIHEVWNFKLVKEKSSAVGSSYISLADAFNHVLKNRYGLQSVVTRWAYNVLYSLEQMKWDPDLELFRLALIRSIPEGAYIDQQVMLTSLRSFLQKLSSLDMGGSLGEVSKATLFASLGSMFPQKKDAFMDELEECVNAEQPMPLVFIDLLLEAQGENGQASNTDTFVAVIKRQHLEEIRDFYVALVEGLQVASLKYDQMGNCKVNDLTQLLQKIDETIHDSQLEHFLWNAFPDRIHSHEDAQHVRRTGKFKESAKREDGKANVKGEASESSADPEMFAIDQFLDTICRGVVKPSSNFAIDPEPVIHT
ncbi:Translin-associated factor X-interacting protein 1 [Hondaea fermentalgiana]|uniref:Translin-associated factor X-interacting protein 1 n=1 Tax=Hondaea fermentalgiana TaxID=2315210 RepID=A0A2R5G3P7_9STRA|nr:Translin-associated factor X-interacting protein 1 [Hondaea fermentalgiana]|eukprot:GBG24378.1 Translin-associated factor X-interacting protein 1 [Hondaea fermentalgiana]